MSGIRFDLIGAAQLGHDEHPQVVARKFGLKVLGYYPCAPADCIYMEVERITNDLPPFIRPCEIPDWAKE